MHTVKASFVFGATGEWRVETVTPVCGDTLPFTPHMQRTETGEPADPAAVFVLEGVRSNDRYVERAEKNRLIAVQQNPGRPSSVCAALIPIRKSAAWWALAQDERRAIFEASSKHIAIGMDYLPAVARRLYHCRDIGGEFDFLTWFEFAEADRDGFDDLVRRLRATEEWHYVEREVDIRLSRAI